MRSMSLFSRSLSLVAQYGVPGGATDTLTGFARVIDGDTIEVAGERVRLYGIDAPEAAQTCQAVEQEWNCGQEATTALAYEVGQHQVTCQERDRDQYGRIVAVARTTWEPGWFSGVGRWLTGSSQAPTLIKRT